MVHCTNRQTVKTIGVPIVTGLPRLYQQCSSVPIVKNSQKQSKDSQNSNNDHWCANRHMSTKTVRTVYQSSKTVKTAKITIGVPIVTCLHRVRRIHKVRVRVRRPHPRPPNTQSHLA